jgi:hypothetical protein
MFQSNAHFLLLCFQNKKYVNYFQRLVGPEWTGEVEEF